MSRAILAVVLSVAAVVGCAHSRPAPPPAQGTAANPAAPHRHFWPFGRRPPVAPELVEELVVVAEPGSSAGFPEFWERNTLIVDMRTASGRGSATFTPRAHTLWPVRIAFRVVPGSIGQLAVKGAERTVFTVAASGSAPVDLRLGPSAYTQNTPELTVVWGPSDVEAAP